MSVDVSPPGPGGIQAVSASGSVRVLYAVAAALGVVILAPIALSSQDLYGWAIAPHGLGLNRFWAPLVPVALDLSAAACIGMTVIAAWRRDRPGVFGLLVWVFALTSAYAQYTHGQAERLAGRAQDAWWAMPAFATLGPLLLEVTLHRLRRWARQDAAEILTGAAGFGVRWLVSPWSTLSAWAASRREGIAQAGEALRFVRDRKTVKALPAVEAVHYAIGACGRADAHAARVWLAARGVTVGQAALDAALAQRRPEPVAGPAPVRVAVPVRRPAVTVDEPVVPDGDGIGSGRGKRQPSAAEQIARAVARTPNATDATIAARLGLSEATVKRHRRRQAVDSVSTDPDPAVPVTEPESIDDVGSPALASAGV